jgi:hypothetical protein
MVQKTKRLALNRETLHTLCVCNFHTQSSVHCYSMECFTRLRKGCD